MSFPKVDVCLVPDATDKYYIPFALVPNDEISDDDADPSWQEVAMLQNCKQLGHASVHLGYKDGSIERFVDTYAPKGEYEVCHEWFEHVLKNARSFPMEPQYDNVFFTITLTQIRA